ncbi:signal transduction histidine kinase [Pedobacter cryoconitis]|uniref:histidine kinase n=1 Tax=Pedobacter cryoconitis TaxID=188932 RepID=A0A7W9DMK2_9SPHI|nr:GAF domain-containing sensor histidine kinase [Pedobacter cryoconitis]MBB5624039.1 signal transduction histidine kinase [Pedobacter cryoconitis]
MTNNKTPDDLIPTNDEIRLKKLYQYEILDTHSETDFDTIALMAAEIFGTKKAFVTFVDKGHVFVKASSSRIEVDHISRAYGLCSLSIMEDDLTIFYDTHQFPELMKNPYISRPGGVRFYAAAQIRTADGFALGTVCVLDAEPRATVTDHQSRMLLLLSRMVMEKLETRMVNRKIVRAYDDRLHRLAHDMKNPITSISLYAQLLGSREMTSEKVFAMAAKIESSSKGVEKKLNNLLTDARSENSLVELVHEPVIITDLLLQMQQSFELSLIAKNQTLIINNELSVLIYADRERILDVLDNLLSNAMKYSYEGATIVINTSLAEDELIIEFKDEGLGLSEEDMKKLFTKFAKLSAIPTAHEKSYGLGLFIVKMLVESHKGKVWAESEGKNFGSSFFISLPTYKQG